MNNSTNNTTTSSNATTVFVDHVKQVLFNLPPITKFAIFAPVIFYIFNVIVWSFGSSINYWLYLDSDLVINSLQIQRLFLYPLSTQNFVNLLLTSIWLLPEIYKAERKMGSLPLLSTLFTLLTVIPGIIYVVMIQILTKYATMYNFTGGYFGMAGWVVGLVLINYLNDGSTEDRMIAGSIRMPNKFWPVIVLLFFVFLAPGVSFILNLSAAVIGYLYAIDRIPKIFIPSEEVIIEYEAKSWLHPLTRLPNFVSVESSSGAYLPIFNNPNTANNISVSSPSTTNTNNNNNTGFPGTGIRLGS